MFQVSGYFTLNIDFTAEGAKDFRKVSQIFFNAGLISGQSSQSVENKFYCKVEKALEINFSAWLCELFRSKHFTQRI
ncbi:hypothetical protein AR687_04565 [Flavobacteriaceae bacterium CRH]|nr:hypothetical protein AR687_04565 [Flavobacteriaceae bacterium CRH]